MEKLLTVSSSPHIRSKEATNTIMRDVVIALMPATAAGIYFFGMAAAIVILLSVVTAVVTEFLVTKYLLKKASTIGDWSAVITGLLLAFNVPPGCPWYVPVIGSAFAIAIAKLAFGGLGHNFINPALAGRAFIMASWPVQMTTWMAPKGVVVDAATYATPLGILHNGLNIPLPSLFDAFIGNIGGCVGETSALALLLGGAYLLYRRVITWHIPTFYIGTVFVLAFLFYDFSLEMALYSVFAGGLMLGAFFMATDYASTPSTMKGHLIFAFGCGLITMVIRKFGGYPEGVSYSILLMNVLTPLIDKYVQPKVFGGGK